MQVAIKGDTYPVRAQLKALGARWVPSAKAWMISPDRAEQARKIVDHTEMCHGCCKTSSLEYYRDGLAYCSYACWMLSR
jgi:hypothetical protein